MGDEDGEDGLIPVFLPAGGLGQELGLVHKVSQVFFVGLALDFEDVQGVGGDDNRIGAGAVFGDMADGPPDSLAGGGAREVGGQSGKAVLHHRLTRDRAQADRAAERSLGSKEAVIVVDAGLKPAVPEGEAVMGRHRCQRITMVGIAQMF